MAKIKDLTGRKFGRLTVLRIGERRITKRGVGLVTWECVCDCGNITTVNSSSLVQKHTKSCGCLNKEYNSKKEFIPNNYIQKDNYMIGYTNKNEEFFFDLDDYDIIKDYCWSKGGDGYISANDRTGRKKTIKMHNLLLNSKYIDHKNRIRHDNRRSNLRKCSPTENARNISLKTNNKSGVTGVFWNKRENKWVAGIKVNKKHIHLGYFPEKEDAIRARLLAEVEYFGEYAPQIHLYDTYDIKVN